MADKDIDIKIRIDDGGAVTVLDNLGNALKKTETQGSAAGSGFTKLQAGIVTLSQGLNIANQAFGFAERAVSAFADTVKRGADVSDINDAFRELSNQAGALSGVLLNQLNAATAGTIDNFSLMREAVTQLRGGLKPDEIVTITQAARAFAEQGEDLKGAIDDITRAMLTGRDMTLKMRGVYVDTETAELKYAASIGKTRDQLTEVQRLEAARAEIMRALGEKVRQTGQITDDAADKLNQLDKQWKDLTDTLSTKAASAFEVVADRIKGGILQELRLLNSEFSRAYDFLRLIGKGQNPLSSANYDRQEMIDNEDRLWAIFQEQLKEKVRIAELDRQAKKTEEQKTKTEEKRQALLRRELELKDQISKKEEERKKWLEEVADIERADQEIASQHFAKIREDARKAGDAQTDAAKESAAAWQDFYMQLGQAAASALVSWRTANNQIAAQNSQIGGSLGTLFGAGIGIAVTQTAAGGQLGASIGSMLGSVIGSLFGGKDSPGTAARKKADKFFADLFDANRLAVIINGELVKIEDLVFRGNTLFGGSSDFANGSFANFFQSLPDQAREAFAGVGAAFEQMLGTVDDMGGQLASVIANNIGGSINNLQLFLQATGKSAQELGDAIMQSMLNGNISFLEAQSGLNGIQKAFEKGIPDGIGMTTQAWQNFVAAGSHGGRVTIDALQDMGTEAIEAGEDMAGLIAQLKEKFPDAAAQIDQVFGVLASQGIDTVQELSNATVEQLLPALSQLEQLQFPWAESLDDVNTLIDRVNEIPKEIQSNITFNVKSNIDGNTRELLDAGAPLQGPGIAAGA